MWQKIWGLFNKTKKKRMPAPEMFTSLGLVKVTIENLKPGMFVSKLDIPWLESPFLLQGFYIETEKDLVVLRETCQYVYIDTSLQKRRKADEKLSPGHLDKESFVFGKPPERLGTFEKEIARAESNYKETGVVVSGFMDKIVDGGEIDAKLAKEAVSSCVNSVLHSPDAFLWLSQLKYKDQYTAQHSLNVCILSIILGREIGLSAKSLIQVGLCGMMHDMGKMLVPLELLNKPGKLDDDEQQIMKSHTILGYELLKSSDNMFYGAVETALTHHERVDGRGYPRKIKGSGLSLYSNIVAIADMYDGITSDKVYNKGQTHHEATKILLDVSGSHLDTKLVGKFIKSLGAYPPGSFVELNNGSVALVLEVNNQFKLWPKVLLILDEDKNPVDTTILDLSEMLEGSADSGSMLSIRAIIKPADYQIDSEKYYRQDVIQKSFTN